MDKQSLRHSHTRTCPTVCVGLLLIGQHNTTTRGKCYEPSDAPNNRRHSFVGKSGIILDSNGLGYFMDWPRILAYITGTVDQELLLRNEYLAAENRILREQVKGRLLLSDSEKKTLAEIGFRLGRKSLEDVANAARPDTILGWYRKLVARKFDGSKARRSPGRPRLDAEIELLIVRMAKDNSGWGYDRIVGALANLGHAVSDQTVGNILRRHGIAPAPKRSQITTWKDFLAAHMNVLAGCDFFTVEVLTWRGLVTYYVLFFLHLESRRVTVAGI